MRASAIQSNLMFGNPDPYGANVAPLLHFDGNNGDTTTTDSSRSGLTVNFYGGSTITTAQSKFGGSSLNVPLTTNARVSTANVAPQQFTGPITIEFWLYLSATTASQYVVASNYVVGGGHAWFYLPSTGRIACYLFGSDSATSAITAGAWHHIAAGFDGTKKYFFVDGSLVEAVTAAPTFQAAPQGWSVGGTEASISASIGGCAVDDFRVTYGVCRYTAAFPVPTSPFPNP